MPLVAALVSVLVPVDLEAAEPPASAEAIGTSAYVAEAPLPEGFPAPGPIDEIVRKSYPGYRAARAESGKGPAGGGAFWKLFQHIQSNDIAMTAPVEMRMKKPEAAAGEGEEKGNGDDGTPSPSMEQVSMAFLYESPTQGDAGADGEVEVVDLPGYEVLSIAFLGRPDEERLAKLAERLRQDLENAAPGFSERDVRLLGYNSPMLPEPKRLYEIQLVLEKTEG